MTNGQFWITVKADLNAGEQRQLAFGGIRRLDTVETGGQVVSAFDVDLEAGSFQKVRIYLLDWNLTDHYGKTVPIETPKAQRDALRALTGELYREIERVIDQHAAAQEKKVPSGPGTPEAAS